MWIFVLHFSTRGILVHLIISSVIELLRNRKYTIVNRQQVCTKKYTPFNTTDNNAEIKRKNKHTGHKKWWSKSVKFHRLKVQNNEIRTFPNQVIVTDHLTQNIRLKNSIASGSPSQSCVTGLWHSHRLSLVQRFYYAEIKCLQAFQLKTYRYIVTESPSIYMLYTYSQRQCFRLSEPPPLSFFASEHCVTKSNLTDKAIGITETPAVHMIRSTNLIQKGSASSFLSFCIVVCLHYQNHSRSCQYFVVFSFICRNHTASDLSSLSPKSLEQHTHTNCPFCCFAL